MRVMQVLRCDPLHRAWLSARVPASATGSAAQQIAALLDDGIGALQAWAADLEPAETFLCYGNDGPSQSAWAAENGVKTATNAAAILAAQIAAFRPDVVLLDAGLTDLVAEARRASVKLFGFAHHRSLAAVAIDRLITPEMLASRAVAAPLTVIPAWDVLCSALVRKDARTVFVTLVALSKSPLGLMGEFSIVYHLMAEAPADLPVGLAVHDRGALYGRAFREAAATARLVIDLDDGAPLAMRVDRLAELGAIGAVVLAEAGPATAIRPGLTTFKTPEQLIQLVYDLLRDSPRREALRSPVARGASPSRAEILTALTAS